MTVAMPLSTKITAELDSGEIKLLGLQTLHPDEAHDAYNKYILVLPDIKKRLINVAFSIIHKAGAEIRTDGDGLTFNGKSPETPDDVQNQLKLSQEAWQAYLDIRPLILKEIELFPLNGIMVRARLFNGKISVIDPDQFSEEDKILVDETIREFGLCEADFGVVGGEA